MSILDAEQAINAARAVLGVLLVDPDAVGPTLHKLTADDFIDPQAQAVFQAMRRLQSEGRPVEPLTVNDALGGTVRQLLADLINNTVTTTHLDEHTELCRKHALQYRMGVLGAQLAEAPDGDAQAAIFSQMSALQCRKPGVRVTNLRQCFDEFIDRHAKGKQPAYITWGIPALDERIYVEAGDFIVLGGYPSAGKTTLALQMAVHIAQEKSVGYFYYENNDRKLFDRVVALRTKISFGKIKRFDLDDNDCERIIKTRDILTSPKLEFVDASGMSVEDLRAIALSRHYGLVIVDYLQKLPALGSRRNISDFERVSQVSSGLQDMGRQTGVTVLALSQLARPEKGSKAKPGMHSFRQSGQIEQDADVAMLLYRENEDDPKNAARVLKIGKNKEGEASLPLRLHFDGNTQTFSRVFPTPAPPKKEPPRQVNFWDGLEFADDDDENPFT